MGTVPTQRFEAYLENTVERLREGNRFVSILVTTHESEATHWATSRLQAEGLTLDAERIRRHFG
ncbi:MAG TPA: hypothetical protein VEY88_14375 [Archangium sp.]|nr:hypothetical protein [Archangium sp.]